MGVWRLNNKRDIIIERKGGIWREKNVKKVIINGYSY